MKLRLMLSAAVVCLIAPANWPWPSRRRARATTKKDNKDKKEQGQPQGKGGGDHKGQPARARAPDAAEAPAPAAPGSAPSAAHRLSGQRNPRLSGLSREPSRSLRPRRNQATSGPTETGRWARPTRSPAAARAAHRAARLPQPQAADAARAAGPPR